MSLQALVMKNRRLTNEMMSRMPAASHVRRGEKRALEVARTAIERTRAYPKHLDLYDVAPTPPRTMDEFRALPLIDKKTYIDCYELGDLVLDGDCASSYTIETSSGHSGGSYYWLRLPEEDAMFPQYLEYAFVQYYGMDKRSTLVLITLALGTWTSGEKMAQALREVAATDKYPMTLMAPGTDLDEILNIVTAIGPYYEQVVIVGYPPFVKTVIDEGMRRGIDWKSLRVRLGLGGEGYSEPWREHMARLIGVDADRDLLAISGGYGAADIGMTVGREYPLTVMIRKLCMDDSELARSLFGNGDGGGIATLPGLLQYSPATVHIEEVEHELVFSVLSGIPLVRYNIHDHGGVLSFDRVFEVLRDHGYDVQAHLLERGYGREQLWQMPFFYVYGRSDGTVSVVGANIFPENIQSVLSTASDQDIVSFKLTVETTETYSQKLGIALEHHSGSLTDSERSLLVSKYRDILVPGLRDVNPDFRDAYEDNPEVADPKVTVHARGTGPFRGPQRIKHQYVG